MLNKWSASQLIATLWSEDHANPIHQLVGLVGRTILITPFIPIHSLCQLFIHQQTKKNKKPKRKQSLELRQWHWYQRSCSNSAWSVASLFKDAIGMFSIHRRPRDEMTTRERNKSSKQQQQQAAANASISRLLWLENIVSSYFYCMPVAIVNSQAQPLIGDMRSDLKPSQATPWDRLTCTRLVVGRGSTGNAF